jgi:hypothetical protein
VTTSIDGTTQPVLATIVTEEPRESVREKVERYGLERGRIIFTWEIPPPPKPERGQRRAAEPPLKAIRAGTRQGGSTYAT